MLEVVLLLLDMFIIENDCDLTRVLGVAIFPHPLPPTHNRNRKRCEHAIHVISQYLLE